MKMFRYVVLAVLALGFSGVANATNIRVLDPSGPQGSLPAIDPTGPNPFTFFSCTFITGDGCFGAANLTDDNITSISFTITTIATAPPITSLDCPTDFFSGLPAAFTNAPVCTFTDDSMTVTFSGGTGLEPGHNLFITEDDIPAGDFADDAGSFTVTTTPEPSSIWMALTGIGSLGYVVRRRRKVS